MFSKTPRSLSLFPAFIPPSFAPRLGPEGVCSILSSLKPSVDLVWNMVCVEEEEEVEEVEEAADS